MVILSFWRRGIAACYDYWVTKLLKCDLSEGIVIVGPSNVAPAFLV